MRNGFYGLVEKFSWKQCLAVCTVLGLEEGKECVIVGTLYKHMKLKPTILDEYSKEVIYSNKYVKYHLYDFLILVLWDWIETFKWNVQRSATPLVQPHNFMHPDDHLVLEDESGRVKLSGAVLIPSVYVTGPYHRMKLNETCCPFLSYWSLEELHKIVINFLSMLIHVAPVHPLTSILILYESIHVAFVVAANVLLIFPYCTCKL